MKKSIILIYLNHRTEAAVQVQKILSAWGCLIKVRLGIHDGVLDDCTDTGLIFLEVVGEKDKLEELTRKLNLIKGVDAKFIEMEIKEDK